jgi:transposase InsO family protein
MKYPVVATLAGQGLPLAKVVGICGVSRSGFYAWANRLVNPSDQQLRRNELTVAIKVIHAQSRNTYGSRRVHAELTMGLGISVSKPTVEKIMSSNGIYGLPTKRKYRKKTNAPTASDLVNRDFGRKGPNQLWVTDITEHPTGEGKLYCAGVLDTHSRKIVGWSINSNQTSKLVTDAIDMAIAHRSPQSTIVHSDHGSQFISWAFSSRIKAAGLTPSMGSIGDGYDNAPMESFWGRMQTELLNTKSWSTRAELASAIFNYIEIFHNRQRRHSSLGYLTPVEYENLQPQATAVA